MSYRVSGTSITLTRGDTCILSIAITDDTPEAKPYIPIAGDSVRFAMKGKIEDAKPFLVINIPIDTMLLIIKPEDTKNLPFGKYVYDVQLTHANADVDTFIPVSTLKLTEEVD